MKVKCINAESEGLVCIPTGLIEGKIYEGELSYDEYWEEERWHIKEFDDWQFKKHRFEEVKEEGEDMGKRLPFKEVIANIKVGEVWKGLADWNVTIKRDKENIVFSFAEEISGYKFDCVSDFELVETRREKYTFTEAFIAYQEGKEIESLFNNFKFKLDVADYRDLVLTPTSIGWTENTYGFCRDEIQGGWYINE